MTARLLALPLMIAGLAMAGAAAFAADASPVGVWKTPEDRGLIRIYECGPALCGRIIGSDTLNANPGLKDAANKDASLRGRPLKDLQLMSGFKGGPKTWKDGRIYRPQDGGTYKGSLELVDAGKLKLTGCAAPLLCQSQVWTRVK
jgi:uncharacterized protein (DUF2147 family)